MEASRLAADLVERFTDTPEAFEKLLLGVPEAEAQVVVHAEMVSRHDEYRLLDAELLGKVGRIDGRVVMGVADRAGVGGSMCRLRNRS